MRSSASGCSIFAMMRVGAPACLMMRRAFRMSSGERTKESATWSMPHLRPIARSLRSFDVSAGRSMSAPGRLIPLCSLSRPPMMTSQSTQPAPVLSTLSTIEPSSRRISMPFFTVCGSFLKLVENSSAVPGMSATLMRVRAPFLRSMGSPLRRRPTRRRGPCRSMTTEQARRLWRESERIRSTFFASSPSEACEQFRRNASTPAASRSSIIAGLAETGPSVARILVSFGRVIGGLWTWLLMNLGPSLNWRRWRARRRPFQ